MGCFTANELASDPLASSVSFNPLSRRIFTELMNWLPQAMCNAEKVQTKNNFVFFPFPLKDQQSVHL